MILSMKLEALKIKNFKAFKDIEIRNIPHFCVIVGANGSGKSTLFGVFGFLQDALNTDVHTALLKQGGSKGFDEVRSRDSTGNIEIELKFRAKETRSKKRGNPLITYRVVIGTNEQGRGIVEREVLKYRRGAKGQPWEFLNFSRGRGQAVTNEDLQTTNERDLHTEPHILKSADILAIKGLAQFEKFPAAVALDKLINGWHLSDIYINHAKSDQHASAAEHLSAHGENLSSVIDYFFQNHAEQMNKIIAALKRRIPGIVEVESKMIETGQMLLKLKDASFAEPFLVQRVSDGTIKMLAYLVLLYDPNPHNLLYVEEPENQLYPTLLAELAEEFRSYAHRGGQVFVSTHSPDFLNAIHMEEVFFLVKEKGYTVIKRASEDPQIVQYMEAGDNMGHLWMEVTDKMGNLWREGRFKGAGP